MSHLSNKSSQNLLASTLLIQEKLYASSVHCSYYAALQHMTCKLKDCLNISFETISENSRGSSSHEYVIKSIINHFKVSIKESSQINQVMREVEMTNIQKLRTKILDLKALRVQSDYHNHEIDEILSSKALTLSNEVIQKLNTYTL